MGEKLNRWLEKPVFIYGFGLFFLVFKTAQFFPYFEWKLFLSFLCLYTAITFTVLLIAQKLGSGKYMAGWLLIIWIALLFTSNITRVFIQDFKIFFNITYLLVTVIIVCIFFYLIKKRLNKIFIQRANKLLNIFLFFLMLINLIAGILNANKEKIHAANKSGRCIPIIQHKNDIIWILLDEYGAPESLNDQFQFHDKLVDSLRNKSFYVFDSLAYRTDATIYTLNSLFNLDDSIPITNYQYAAYYLKKSKWVEELEKQGYSFIDLDFLNIGGKEKFININIFPDNYTEKIFNNTFFAILLNNLKGIDDKMRIDDYNGKVIQALTKTVQQKVSYPRFIWSHLMIPHLPFYRNENGSLNPKPLYDPVLYSKAELSKQYLDYVSYANSVVLKILNEIPDRQQKTIIITGDHGARMLVSKNDKQRFETFAAIYYPRMDTTELINIRYLQQIPLHLH